MSKLYDRNFAVAFAAQTFFVLANAMMAHYARFIAYLGGDVQQIGWITGAGAVAGLALRPFISPWIDRFSARTTWALGYVIYVAAIMGNLFLTGLGPAIYLLRTATEVGIALCSASSITYITQTAPPERRTEAIGTLGAGGFVGMIIGPFAGDLLLGHDARSYSSFVWMFSVIAVSVALGAAMICLLRKPQTQGPAGPAHPLQFAAVVRRHWPGAVMWINVVFGMCMTIPFVFLSKYVDVLGIRGIGSFFMVYAGWGLFLRLRLRQLPDRIGRRRVLLFGMLCMAVGMFSFVLVNADRWYLLLLAAFITGTGHSLIFHPMVALSLEPFPNEARGAGSVLALIALDCGRIAGAPLLGTIGFYFGYNWMFVFVGSATLATSAMYYRSIRRAAIAEPTAADSFFRFNADLRASDPEPVVPGCLDRVRSKDCLGG